MISGVPARHLSPAVSRTVRYLAGKLSDVEADEYRAIVSHNPSSRAQMVEVSKLLKELKAMPFAEVARLRGEPTLRGEVARAWMTTMYGTVAAAAMLGISRGKVAFQDLAEALRANSERILDLRVLLSPQAPRRLAPATMRGAEDELKVEASIGEDGELTLKVAAPTGRHLDWEGRKVEVTMLVEIPVVLGAGELHDGKLELHVPEAAQLLGRDAGPVDSWELSVGVPTDSEEAFYILPVDDADTTFEHPRLLEPMALDAGTLKMELAVPEPLRTAFDGKRLELFVGLADGHFQKLLDVPLAKATGIYRLTVGWPDAEELSGRLAIGLRYRIEA